MKQIKKSTPHTRALRKRKQISIAVFSVIEILILLCFAGIFYNKRQLSDKDVTALTVSASECTYSVSNAPRRAQVLRIGDERYVVSARFKKYFYEAMENEGEVTLTVISSPKILAFGKQKIVGIRGDSTVYFEMTDYNEANAWVPHVYVSDFLVLNISYILFAVFYIRWEK